MRDGRLPSMPAPLLSAMQRIGGNGRQQQPQQAESQGPPVPAGAAAASPSGKLLLSKFGSGLGSLGRALQQQLPGAPQQPAAGAGGGGT
jgi:hypothetical protein